MCEKKFIPVILGIAVISIVSCSGNKFVTEIERFKGTEIVLPSDMRQVYMNRDTSAINLDNSSVKIVIHIDSLECSSCRIKSLSNYDEVIDFANMFDGGYIPVFIFSPHKDGEIEVMQDLRKALFEYPVFIDCNGSFVENNPTLPSDSRLHTFLIDKNGKVVLCGDPSYNSELWTLYKQIISQMIADGEVP